MIGSRTSRKGIPKDLGKLFQAVAPDVIMVLVHHFGIQRSFAEDALQNVFLYFVRQSGTARKKALLDRFKSISDFRRYVLRAALNQYRDVYRHMIGARQKEFALIQALEISPSANTLLFGEREIVALHRAVSRLKNPYRHIFELLLDKELSLAEIARRLRRNPGSIYTQYARGFKLLRELVIEEINSSQHSLDGEQLHLRRSPLSD